MPPAESLLLIAVVFLFAGWVKGVVGMGPPTVAIGALGLVMAPVQAASLLVVPSLVTNVWQFVAGPARAVVARRLASMLVFVCIGTAPGIPLMTSRAARWPSIALGAVFAVYALLASLGAVVPALAGMFIGQRTRDRIEPVAFRRWFFIAMLLVGGYMVVRGLLST